MKLHLAPPMKAGARSPFLSSQPQNHLARTLTTTILPRAIGGGDRTINAASIVEEVSNTDELAQKIADAGIDMSMSGLATISDEAKLRALAKKANKFEKIKNEKCGSHIWTEVQDLAVLIREGKTTWADLNLDDVDVRLKWSGLFHRRKRTPGRFMMRLKVILCLIE